jgi:hypothetical protein
MVGNLNVRRPCIGPNKADPELIVDADTVLSRFITHQSFEADYPADFRSSSTVAASSIVSLRVATLRIAPKRCDFSDLKSSSVSLHLNP